MPKEKNKVKYILTYSSFFHTKFVVLYKPQIRDMCYNFIRKARVLFYNEFTNKGLGERL